MSSTPDTAVTADVEAYAVEAALPGVDAIDPGTNILVRGPAMSGRRDLALDLLADGGPDEHAVVVTTDRGARRMRDAYAERTQSRCCLVDCSGRGDDDLDCVERVSSPGDLTGIGIGVVKSTRELDREPLDGIRLGMLSVSTLLQYAAADRVFNFLHVLSGRFAEAGYLGVFTLDPTAHDPQTVSSVRSLFDAEAEIRETEDGRQLRVRGLSGAPADWLEWDD